MKDTEMQKQTYEWQQSRLGGGGYITGIVEDPFDGQTVYARCDVAGMFRSADGGCSWEPLNDGMSAYHHHQVHAIAVSPHVPGLLLRASGEVRSYGFKGSIHRSQQYGQHWQETETRIDFYGNGQTRMYGEILAWDPFHREIVLSGSYAGGIWQSRDEGRSWALVQETGERLGCVAFHPAVQGLVYAGTIGDLDVMDARAAAGEGRLVAYLQQLGDQQRGAYGSLYLSRDSGQTWECLYRGSSFAQLVFDAADPQRMYAACISSGIARSEDGGQTWTPAGQGLPEGFVYGTVTMSRQSRTLYTAPDVRPHDPGIAPVPVYESRDQARSWQLVRTHQQADLVDYPAYMAPAFAGWAIAKLVASRHREDTLYLTNWYGVSVSHDGGLTWTANRFEGLETICCESVVATPSAVWAAVADHPPLYSLDKGQTYHALPRLNDRELSTSALVASAFREGYTVYGVVGWGKPGKHGCLVISEHCEQEPQIALELAEGLFVQALVEDPFRAGVFYAYIDGNLAAGAGLYRSTDWGRSWQRQGSFWAEGVQTLPHQKAWVEADLLAVTAYQQKNACGTNQLLAADPFHPDVLLIGEWSEGLYRSPDGGASWQSIGEGLPFLRTPVSLLNVIRVDPFEPNVYYAGFVAEGLWKSTDAGRSWRKLFPTDARSLNATTLALAAHSRGTLALGCEPLFLADCESAVYVSEDGGEHWHAVQDRDLGAIRWKSLAWDTDAHRLYAGSCGNGLFSALGAQTRKGGE